MRNARMIMILVLASQLAFLTNKNWLLRHYIYIYILIVVTEVDNRDPKIDNAVSIYLNKKSFLEVNYYNYPLKHILGVCKQFWWQKRCAVRNKNKWTFKNFSCRNMSPVAQGTR